MLIQEIEITAFVFDRKEKLARHTARQKQKPYKRTLKSSPAADGLPTYERLKHLNHGVTGEDNFEMVNETQVKGSMNTVVNTLIPVAGSATTAKPLIAERVLGRAGAAVLSKYLKFEGLAIQATPTQQFGDSGGQNGGKRSGGGIAGSDEQRAAHDWMDYVRANLAPEHIARLQFVVDHHHNEGREQNIYQLGHLITFSDNRDKQEGGVIGYLKAVADALVKVNHDYNRMRRNMAVDRQAKLYYKNNGSILVSKFT